MSTSSSAYSIIVISRNTIRFKSATDSKVLSFIIPFDLEKPDPAIGDLLSSATVPVSLWTVFTKNTPEAVEGLRWALKTGKPVDIEFKATLSDSLLEGFEDLMAKASADLKDIPPIVLCTSSQIISL